MPTLLVANFKSNQDQKHAKLWVQQFSTHKPSDLSVGLVLCPSFTHVELMKQLCIDQNIALGAQDCSMFPSGSYTGAISAQSIADSGVSYCIVGHSERRAHFHETCQDVANKVRECMSAGITPILCITPEILDAQAATLTEQERAACCVAFEPITAIGSGTTDTLEHIIAVKKRVAVVFGRVPYLYGGSVDQHTNPQLLHSKEIDGFLIGSACVDASSFCSLLSLF